MILDPLRDTQHPWNLLQLMNWFCCRSVIRKILNCTMQYYPSRPVIIPVLSHLPWKHTVQAAVLQALEHYHTDKIFQCLQMGTPFKRGWSEEIRVKCLSQGHNVGLPRPGLEPSTFHLKSPVPLPLSYGSLCPSVIYLFHKSS